MRRFLSWMVNAAIARLEYRILLGMLYRFDAQGRPAALDRDHLEYLKYFTVLSNMLLGVAAALYCATLLLALCGVLRRMPGWVIRAKHTAVTLTTLTFLTVLVYIGPKTGFRTAYTGPNLWFHLILPLLAVADFALLDREGILSPRSTLLPLAPVAAYGAFYLGNLIVNGWGGRSHPNDWYGFADSGPAGAFAAVGALLFSGWMIAALLRLMHTGNINK